MILLFGQVPQRSTVDRQTVLHGLVGSIADLTPPVPTPPIGGGGGSYYGKTYIRRNSITPVEPELDEDLIAALTIFTLLRNET